MGIIKLCGMAGLIITGWLVGFKKSADLRFRVQRLKKLYEETEELLHRLQYEGLERDRLLLSSFSDFCLVRNGKILFNESGLTAEDAVILKEMIQKLGTGNLETEEKRLLYVLERLRQQESAAQKIAVTNGKIYQTLGTCAGIMICIFLL